MPPVLLPQHLRRDEHQLLHPLRVQLRVNQGDMPTVRVSQHDRELIQPEVRAEVLDVVRHGLAGHVGVGGARGEAVAAGFEVEDGEVGVEGVEVVREVG